MNIFKIEALNQLFVKFFNSINSLVLNNITPNKNVSYGLSIIILTVIIRALLSPLNVKQIRSSIMMNKVGPEIKKIQARYKSDPQKLNQETMKLYKDKGINPLSGCLPLLFQWPILIALYYVFSSLQIQGIGFLWIKDLSSRPTMSDWTTWILPIVSGATTYFSGMIMSMSADPSTKKQSSTMNIVMSVMLLWMSCTVNAALVLYWVTGNIIMLIQNRVIMVLVEKSIENEKNESNDVDTEEKMIEDEGLKVNSRTNKKTTRRERREKNNDQDVKKDNSSNS